MEEEEEQLVGVDATILLSGEQSHEQFGHSFSVAPPRFVENECKLILIGSTGYSKPDGHPQTGSAKIFNTCDTSAPIELLAATSDDVVYERFGATTLLEDVNADGELDAVVCAPSWGGENVEAVVGNYTGRCDFFYGPLVGGGPTFSIYGDVAWGLFGKKVKVGDVNSDGKADVVINAPQTGTEVRICEERSDEPRLRYLSE